MEETYYMIYWLKKHQSSCGISTFVSRSAKTTLYWLKVIFSSSKSPQSSGWLVWHWTFVGK